MRENEIVLDSRHEEPAMGFSMLDNLNVLFSRAIVPNPAPVGPEIFFVFAPASIQQVIWRSGVLAHELDALTAAKTHAKLVEHLHLHIQLHFIPHIVHTFILPSIFEIFYLKYYVSKFYLM